MFGTLFEYYDFFAYGTAAALVFPKLFFANEGPALGTLLSLATFAVAFVLRPIGGIVFGHIGDRYGRKKSFIATLLIMGVSTVLVGVLPGESTLGPSAAIILVVLRMIQGFGAGGEFGTASLVASENAPAGKRALFTIAPAIGNAGGFLIATSVYLLLGVVLAPVQFDSWGWRIPFLAGGILVIAGLITRAGLNESSAYQKAKETNATKKAPLVALIRHHGGTLLIGIVLTTLGAVFFYIATVFLSAYGTHTLKYDKNSILLYDIIGVFAFFLAAYLAALAADRWGRKRVLLAVTMYSVIIGLIFFPLVKAGLAPAALAVCLALIINGGVSPIAIAVLAETFPAGYRTTGVGLAYACGTLIGGGIIPTSVVPLAEGSSGTLGITIILTAIAVLGVVCSIIVRESHGNFDDERAEPAAQLDPMVPQKSAAY